MSKKNILGRLSTNKHFGAYIEKSLSRIRSYFSSSQNEEELNRKLLNFYRPFSFFYRNGFPGRLKNSDIRERKDFLIANASPLAIDIGMQDGYFVKELNYAGCETMGVDNVAKLVRYAKKKDPAGKYFHGFAEELPFPDNTFQTAICSHILEHVLYPDKLLRESKRVLKPNGKIIIIVPYELGLEPTHLRDYNKETLLKEVGAFFTITEYFKKIGAGHGCIAYK
ncbi:MAG: hypothetical protein DKM50_14160 [Candidatus Margulisiibacteriota bacterium]|nr:MAG: hypothetical protein A2X43_09295 [Candidatus Margulisbacteria bacterium GWD2_39_127]OGI09070.1 MAG: hypothetical protein A2X41_00900 [Candidatus Margulisbacteria bacterium GWE2_39_32]PZM77017.1 MAG: hypothetical protein DKM50_14160 [Candidatus Margulisiibacteriota bacterium]HAR64071.1 hypothetical protein [Candidatus Margulisiibacteriota bacterium]HCT84959.1 hypothetical protein [Candidatus Margulisiibacteriota bacterium]